MEALIVHHNTPLLTKATVASVRKFSPNLRVTIYDSSSNYNGDADIILRNHIDFDAFLAQYPDRIRQSNNGYGSAKHCYTVDYCFRFFPDGFILLDSDVLLKRDVSELWKPDKIWVGQPHVTKKHPVRIPRLYPFCCYINTKMCHENGVRYFDGKHMWELVDHPTNRYYDTGAWFLQASSAFPSEVVGLSAYIEHYGGGSWNDKPETPERWLARHEHLYL